jgi:hypothetical protein
MFTCLGKKKGEGEEEEKRRDERNLAGLYVHNPLVLNWRIELGRYAW